MKFATALFGVSIFLGAASSRGDLPPKREIVVTDEDMGKTVNLGAGDTLVVRLRSNPSTGYSWYTVLAPSSLITLVGHTYTPDRSPSRPIGAGGVEEFRFRRASAAQGAEWFRMLSLRPFERGVSDARLWEVQIVE